MNYHQLLIESVYKFERYQALYKSGRINKNLSYLKNRFLYLKSLTRPGNFYIPSKTKYKLDKKLIFDAHKFIDSKLFELSRSCLFLAEIKKSCIRASLRYGFKSMQLSACFLKEIYRDEEYPFKIKNYKWMNPVHPVIHLPNDIEETGRMHVDLHIDGGKTITVWIPFTEYKYPGIVTKRKIYRILGQYLGEKIANFIFKRVRNLPLIKESKPGEWISWNDTFRHQGNLNQTNEINIAFMIRFSNTFHSNNWLPIEKLLKIKQSDNDYFLINQNKLLIDNALNIVNEFVNQIDLTNAGSHDEFLVNIKQSNLINNILNNLNSNKKEIFLLHIAKYVLSTTLVKIKSFKYIEFKSKNNLLLQEFLELSINYLDLKIAEYFY